MNPLVYEEEMRIFSKALANKTGTKEKLTKDQLLEKVSLVREEMLMLYKQCADDAVSATKAQTLSIALKNICHVLMIEHIHSPVGVDIFAFGNMLNEYADAKGL